MSYSESNELSYSRKIQAKIYEAKNPLIQAKINYNKFKHRNNDIYESAIKPLVTQNYKEKAEINQLKNLLKDKLKIQKEAYKLQLFEVKDQLKLDKSEIKNEAKLKIVKVEMNYKRELINLANDKEKLVKFKTEYKKYIGQFKTFQKDEIAKEVSSKQEAFDQKLINLSNQNEAVNKELINKYSKAYLSQLKKEKQAIIDLNDIELKKIKTIKDDANKADEKLIVELKEVVDKEQKIFKTQLTILNDKKKAHYQTLSKEEKKKFDIEEEKVKQDRKAELKNSIDKVERRIFKNINPAYIYIIPALFSALFFTVVPFIFMLVASFFKVNLTSLGKSTFQGINNFITIFTRDVEFQKSLSNTLIYALITVLLLTVVTIAMAAWLAKNTKIHNIAQTMIFTPHIASLVAISILWIALLNPNGLINQLLAYVGIEGPGWLIQENTSLLSISFVAVWKDIGYYVLIIIAGLQAIPNYVYEAAKLDKASKFKTFFKITFPLLAPTLSFVFVNNFINSFKVFAPIEIMTNGGPLGSSMVLSYWIYKVGRIGYNYGFAMAGAIVLTILIAVFTWVNYKFFNKKVTY